ncbi:MAG: enoyl-CoA hydratase [Thermodesulfobacteriota bacterium]
MTEPVLLIEKDQGITTLTLNRPGVLNALSRELRLALSAALADLARDPETGVVILTGAGRAFCAGLDLKELAAEGMTGAGKRRTEEKLIDRMRDFPQPLIGAINGVAVTGGFELALACDILIASTKARFADTHARVGIVPGWGLSQKLSRLIGPYRAKELSFTGNYLGAEQAEAWGLVNRVVAPDELLPAARALAWDILSCDRDFLARYKGLIDRGYGLPLAEALEMETLESAGHSLAVTAESVAARRQAVLERGRRQTRDQAPPGAGKGGRKGPAKP